MALNNKIACSWLQHAGDFIVDAMASEHFFHLIVLGSFLIAAFPMKLDQNIQGIVEPYLVRLLYA